MIDQRFCKYIKTIAQYHSFSKAAQVLYVSQPALSRFVKKVEDELGVTLFDRDTIPLRLTLAGQRYLEYVEQFQGLERNMRQEFSAMGKQSFNRLTIATSWASMFCHASYRILRSNFLLWIRKS